MEIPLHLIETFTLYAENKNLAETARRLGQTQPSATRQIQQFQKHFKKTLFQNKGLQKRLTPYGEEVYNYYKDGVLKLRELRNNFSNISIQNQKEFLVLAARSEILQKHVTPLKLKSPAELMPMSGQQIRAALDIGQIDMAVYDESFETFDYFRKKLFVSKMKIIIPNSWKISTSNTEKALDQCSPLPFASYDRSAQYLNVHRLKSFQLPPLDIQFIANDWRLLVSKVESQACWAIVPSDYADSKMYTSLSLDQQMKPTQFYIYFKKDLRLNKDVQYIIDQLS
jgi:DNA-binding transcriptional LysR family regulator